jgi:hypothetical protein
MLGEHLKQIENLNAAIRRVSQEIADRFGEPDPHLAREKPLSLSVNQEKPELSQQTQLLPSCASELGDWADQWQGWQ